MLMILFLLLVSCTTTKSDIAYAIPSFSDPSKGVSLFYQIAYGLFLGLYLCFVVLRKPLLSGLQKQAIILQGIYFGVDLVGYTLTFGLSSSLTWLVALIAAPVAALLSVNDKIKNTLISLINGFAISYLCTLVFRLNSKLQAGIILGAAFFIIHILISGSEVFQVCFAKIFTCTISVISLIDLVRVFSIFAILHGGAARSKFVTISTFIFAAVVMAIFSAYFIGMTYFSTWMDKKTEEIKNKVVKGPAEETKV